MDAQYSVGEYVYVRSLISEVDKDKKDVLYTVSSAISKFRLSQENDTLTQDPYTTMEEEKAASKSEGEEYFYDCMLDIMINYTSTEIKECFGSNYNTIDDVMEDTANWDCHKILEAWEIYTERNSIVVESVVYYTLDNTEYLCVVINIESKVDKNIYVLYCPDERSFFKAEKNDMRVEGRTANIDEIMDELDKKVRGYDENELY